MKNLFISSSSFVFFSFFFIKYRHWTHHSEKFLYMLLEYVCGGELFSYLRNAVKFSNDTAVFYTAEIISALDYLHSQSIIYR